MPQSSRTETIQAPVDVVWGLLADGTYTGPWFGKSASVIENRMDGALPRQMVELSVKDGTVSLVVETTHVEKRKVFAQEVIAVDDVAQKSLTELRYELSPTGEGVGVTVQAQVPERQDLPDRLTEDPDRNVLDEMLDGAIEGLREAVSGNVTAGIEAGDRSSAIPPAPAFGSVEAVLLNHELNQEGAPPGQPGGETQAAQAAPSSEIPGAPPHPGAKDKANSASQEAHEEDETKSGSLTEVSTASSSDLTTNAEATGDIGSAVAELQPSSEAIGEVIRAWAKGHPFIKTSRFTGETTQEFIPVFDCEVTRLIETREESHVQVPGNHRLDDLHRYGGLVESVNVFSPTDFERAEFKLVQDGSERTLPCPRRCAGGQVRCNACVGGVNRCSSCGGSGQRTETRYVNGRQMQQRTPCSSCGGSGQQPCFRCQGSGMVVCSTCNGSTQVIEYLEGTIIREPETASVSNGEQAPPEVKLKKFRKKKMKKAWELVYRSDQSSVPEGLPPELAEQLSLEQAKYPGGELIRKLEINVLPITRVNPGGEDKAVIHVVGVDRKVMARQALSNSRIYLALFLSILIAVIVLVALST